MTIRFIVRPARIKRTPKRLSRLLGARRTAPVNGPSPFDWHRDLFLAYPPPDKVLNSDDKYATCHSLYTANKPQQRALLAAEGVPIVPCVWGDFIFGGENVDWSHGYITRPLRHSSGDGFLFTAHPPQRYSDTYFSPCIKKVKEFRVIYYRGQRVSTYLKTNPNGVPYNEPWNFSNGCVFHTITRPENDILKHINFYDTLDVCTYSRHTSLCAYDILLDENNKAYVSEINLSPGISIPRTLSAIQNIEQQRIEA